MDQSQGLSSSSDSIISAGTQVAGVIYYNTGTKCLARLAVSIRSLKKHYSGPIAIISDGPESSRECEFIAKVLGVDCVHTTISVDLGPQETFLKKTLLHRYTPYDISLYLDSDTLVRRDPKVLLAFAAKHDFVATNFANWVSTGNTMRSRIMAWQPHYPNDIAEAINFGPALNAGVYAFKKSSEFMADWYNLTLPGRHIFLPEETSMQVHLRKYKHFVAPQEFNCSCKHSKPEAPNVAIIHYHRNKHCRQGLPFSARLWVDEYDSMIEEYPQLGDLARHDRTLRSFLATRQLQSSSLSVIKAVTDLPATTLVTAVSANMFDVFRRTAPTWQLKKQFRDWPMIVFTHGVSHKQIKRLVGFPNLTCIDWDHQAVNMREKMISAFVYGAAQHVRTPYYVKLDCDAYFTDQSDIFRADDYKAAFTGHRWGLSLKAFIDILNDWADSKGLPGERIADNSTGAKVVMPRIISWICLHDMSFLAKAVALSPERMPVPSHDTYLWYLASRLNIKWQARRLNHGAGHSKKFGLK